MCRWQCLFMILVVHFVAYINLKQEWISQRDIIVEIYSKPNRSLVNNVQGWIKSCLFIFGQKPTVQYWDRFSFSFWWPSWCVSSCRGCRSVCSCCGCCGCCCRPSSWTGSLATSGITARATPPGAEADTFSLSEVVAAFPMKDWVRSGNKTFVVSKDIYLQHFWAGPPMMLLVSIKEQQNPFSFLLQTYLCMFATISLYSFDSTGNCSSLVTSSWK